MLEQYIPIGVMILFGARVRHPHVESERMAWTEKPHRRETLNLRKRHGTDPQCARTVSVKYYMVAMLFIVFDIEVVFMYPWAVNYRHLGLFGLVEMFVFIVILLFGYLYLWKKGALKWN